MSIDLNAQDTIAAVATASGAGAIAIIRVSGPACEKIRDTIFVSARSVPWTPGVLRLGRLRWPDASAEEKAEPDYIDEVMLVFFAPKKSYTGEASLEIHVHGGVLNTRRCLDAVLAAGARMAGPGEFTRRAYLSGRMDMSQAEAVQDIINARSEAALKLAQRNLAGAAAQALEPLRAQLLSILAEIEAGLDFPEEAFPEERMLDFARRVHSLHQRVDAMLDASRAASRLNEQARVVLLGPPNAGKSSLFNALTLTDQAIINARPGTTRDVLEASLALNKVELKLIDTAGLRDSDDEIESEAQRRARQQIARADLSVVVMDGSVAPDQALKGVLQQANNTALLVVNKADLPASDALSALLQTMNRQWVTVSARTGQGLDKLRQLMFERTRPAQALLQSGWLAQQQRQVGLLRDCAAALDEARHAIDLKMPEEIVATELRRGLLALSQILGRELGDEVLHEIFARFCVGK